MRDIEIHHLATELSRRYHFRPGTIATLLNEIIDFHLDSTDVSALLAEMPKTRYSVLFLDEMGFSRKAISRRLSISEASVAYHIGQGPPTTARNIEKEWRANTLIGPRLRSNIWGNTSYSQNE